MRIEMRTTGDAAGVRHVYSAAKTELFHVFEMMMGFGPVTLWTSLHTSLNSTRGKPYVHAWACAVGHVYRPERSKP
jgi:hypothetical protein